MVIFANIIAFISVLLGLIYTSKPLFVTGLLIVMFTLLVLIITERVKN